ncbi:DUF3592 domain-containing protein [Piscinibacter gummiphilus]|uniref:DUF3592 domain-containing protein n=1 Tax=Piscinibacter gummiphilus TaxID=946333 RepID=A0ABZ0CYU0_9BURK|nr:DUF3592 domain-containing protein [Piscinibacter gummiphilus]WOB10119.1 DUF3592 domain-containing protein [Piscinibacter gummiphilus]
MRRSILPTGVQLAVLLFLGFVGLNFCLGAFDYYKARRSGDWPQVDGRVVRSGVVAGCRRGGSFAPEVRYTYPGGGRTHTGNRWRFGSAPCGDEASARAIAASHPVGGVVRVSVNPDDASESVLRPGEVQPYAWLGFAVQALMFAAGAMFIVRSPHA